MARTYIAVPVDPARAAEGIAEALTAYRGSAKEQAARGYTGPPRILRLRDKAAGPSTAERLAAVVALHMVELDERGHVPERLAKLEEHARRFDLNEHHARLAAVQDAIAHLEADALDMRTRIGDLEREPVASTAPAEPYETIRVSKAATGVASTAAKSWNGDGLWRGADPLTAPATEAAPAEPRDPLTDPREGDWFVDKYGWIRSVHSTNDGIMSTAMMRGRADETLLQSAEEWCKMVQFYGTRPMTPAEVAAFRRDGTRPGSVAVEAEPTPEQTEAYLRGSAEWHREGEWWHHTSGRAAVVLSLPEAIEAMAIGESCAPAEMRARVIGAQMPSRAALGPEPIVHVPDGEAGK